MLLWTNNGRKSTRLVFLEALSLVSSLLRNYVLNPSQRSAVKSILLSLILLTILIVLCELIRIAIQFVISAKANTVV